MITRNLRSRKLNSRNTKNSNLQTRCRGFEGTEAFRLGSDNDIPEKIKRQQNYLMNNEANYKRECRLPHLI